MCCKNQYLVISEAMRVMGFVNRFNWGIKNAQLNLKNNKNEPAEFDLNTVGVFRVIIKEKPIEKINASFSNPWDGETIEDIDNRSGGINGSINSENGYVNEKSGYINGENGYVNGSVNEKSGYVNNHLKVGNLSENEKVVFYIIKDNENINQKKINELFPIPKRTLTRYLKTLKNKGLIEFVGSTKTGGYRITFIMT